MSQWKELFEQIVATDVCCSCAACVLVCPHHVLDYDFDMEKPFQTDPERPDDCSHGIKGCTLCAQACPRLDHDAGIWRWNWPQLEEQLFGRTRNPDEIFGVAREVVVARAAQDSVVAAAQDGGIATALILHGLETGALDGAVVSGYDGKTQMTEPKLIKTAEDALATAKSRYTYAPTPLAMKEAFEQKLRKIALVGVSCEITAAPKMTYAGVRKWSNRIALTVGLMCSETFLPKPFLEQKLQGEYGIDMTKVDKINIKGKVIVTMDDGHDVDIPLKDCRPLARDWGCPFCPDFSAEHADIALGGLGMEGWCMVVVRTERGAQWWKELVDAGKVEVRPAAEEQGAYDLMGRLAKRQRRRTRNIELWLEQGKVEPWNAEEAEALHKRGTPEAAFKPGGSRNISALSQVSIAGPSPRGAK
ncbi:MAG TPA: Coenzyme F420 hydrogenase/dehydrogenase, beta subunit C-terminal domain [Actinomycetota bacterium]|jgi:coenzyme F420 hydrogenase subunit beta|nr:Coenzyme F420 hydrogenase/dehydrogenase, beta subunit C-terminal domain [Actinomycetota bacterium]